MLNVFNMTSQVQSINHNSTHTNLQSTNKKLKSKIETMNYNKKPHERRVITRTELCI